MDLDPVSKALMNSARDFPGVCCKVYFLTKEACTCMACTKLICTHCTCSDCDQPEEICTACGSHYCPDCFYNHDCPSQVLNILASNFREHIERHQAYERKWWKIKNG